MSDPLLDGPSMPIVGYTDRLSCFPGERLSIMVSTDAGEFDSDVISVSHVERWRQSVANCEKGRHSGRLQPLRPGSYIRFASDVEHPAAGELSVWVRPTAVHRPNQGLLTWSDGDGLFIHEGFVELRRNGATLRSDTPVRSHSWTLVTAGIDIHGRAYVRQARNDRRLQDSDSRGTLPSEVQAPGRFLIAAAFDGREVNCFYDGKIDDPTVKRVGGEVVARWDLSREIGSRMIVDSGPEEHHGETVNHPTRAVTGHNWSGREVAFRHAPDEYGAISFHRDDLSDAGWELARAIDIPADLPPGLYAVRVRCEAGEDHVPFVVRARPGASPADVAVILPTFTYLAYGNERHWWDAPVEAMTGSTLAEILTPADRWAYANDLLSVYDDHLDGTGTVYASLLRPITNMRPDYVHPLLQAPHLLGADVHILDCLRTYDIAFDVLTDEDVHREGAGLLSQYRVVMSGTHPEYCTIEMLDAIEQHVGLGGNFMYLGGNGFYWVVSVDAEAPYVMEHRRGQWGTRPWQSEPGENHHATTGEPGGLWRGRGRAPQTIFGIGFNGFGFGEARAYTRSPASHAADYAWVFDGVEADTFGDFGLLFGGAAGFEVDGVDERLGTAAPVTVLATSAPFESYSPALENILSAGHPPPPTSHVVIANYASGGRVFATGSIAWGLSLAHDNFDNDVARITMNVVRRFRGD